MAISKQKLQSWEQPQWSYLATDISNGNGTLNQDLYCAKPSASIMVHYFWYWQHKTANGEKLIKFTLSHSLNSLSLKVYFYLLIKIYLFFSFLRWFWRFIFQSNILIRYTGHWMTQTCLGKTGLSECTSGLHAKHLNT